MKLTGLHLLLTYQCNFECDHCFVWGSPWQSGTMTLKVIRDILRQAEELGTVDWIYFEGGEPFLYYPIMVKGVREAVQMGFRAGIVSNAYWGTSVEDALEWLSPFAATPGGRSLIEDISISSDLYHYSDQTSQQVRNASQAAEQLGIPLGVISVAQPETAGAEPAVGKLPIGESKIMYRGRAAEKLVSQATLEPWSQFTECPYEDLREPGRVHVDPLGNIHICQGISLGNIFQTSLIEICKSYEPDGHPITRPLLENGPVGLVQRYDLPHKENYADACHLCDEARRNLRARFPDVLTPDQIYGLNLD